MTCEEWLESLRRTATEESWHDPEFVHFASWVLVMFLPRAISQLMLDAQPGCAVDLAGEPR